MIGKRRVVAIITAAGKGERFSSNQNLPKQFIRLNNKPVILYSLLTFQSCKLIDDIYVSSSKKYFDLVGQIVFKNKITKLCSIVEGGKTRFDSVKNVFRKIHAEKNDLILIHDAARPNINISFVEGLIKEAAKFGEVVPAISISDTIKKEKNNYVAETIDRNNLRLVQTPQVFRYNFLKKSYTKTRSKNFTDESSLVEKAGFKVRIVEGLLNNVKLTNKNDFELLKSLLK